MIQFKTVRKITKVVVGVGVWYTVGNIIDNNVTPENRRQRVEAWLGSSAIAWVVAEQVDLYIDRKFDGVLEAWNEARAKKIEVKVETEQDSKIQD